MQEFRVWVRPLGEACRIRVDGQENASWLLSRLSESVVVENCGPIGRQEPFGFYTFQVPYSPRLTRSTLDELLDGIPEVKLMSQPA